jgi:hypothetical protein
MTRVLRVVFAAAVVCAGLAPAVRGGEQSVTAPSQTGPVPLGQLIPGLFERTIVLATTGHQAHFVDSSMGLREAGLRINESILSQLTSYPISSAGGGFTFSFDPTLGVMTRSSESFGPIFAERAETIGEGKWNFGVKYLRFRYDAIDDLGLDDGDLRLSFTHLDTNEDGTTVATVYEGDLIRADARLRLSNDTTVVSGQVGLSDRFDLTVAVPVVKVDLEATLDTRIDRLATEGLETPPAHVFPGGGDRASFGASGSASGIGDVLVRAKWNLARLPGRGLATALEVRLPTGDEQELLGTGATQTRLSVIGSASFGRFAPHVNAGYATYSGDGPQGVELPDEASFALGFDWAAHPRVTIAADLLWRTLFDANQLRVEELTHLYKRWDATAITQTTRPALGSEKDDLDLLSGALGCKVNLSGQILVTANLLWSLSSDGLRDADVVPLVGIDYSF